MSYLSAGTLLRNGKYRIEKVLGKGSFGITYLAATPMKMKGSLGEMTVDLYVTIKEFFMAEMNTRSADGTRVEGSSVTLVTNYKRKFMREAENLSHLNHENIIKVLEVFEENNTAYYVMEYVDGGSIDELITRHGSLNPAQTITLVRQICKALEYMHANFMLHLDLKPKNIMISSKNQVKLIDFGLSKQYSESGQPEESTSIGLGTPGYAPVEQSQFRQDGTLPVTLDVYALGATMFKMLTGTVPPESSYILNNDTFLYDSLSKTRIPLPLVNVVCKAMAPLKKNRYQSVLEIDNELSKMNVDERAALQSLNVVSDNVNGGFQNTPYTSGTPYGRKTPAGTPQTPPPYKGHTSTGTPHTPPPYQGPTPMGKPQTPPPPPPSSGGQGPKISRLVSGGAQQKPPLKGDGDKNPKKKSKIKWIILAVVLALLVGVAVLIVMNISSKPQTHFIETGGDSYYNDDDGYDYAVEEEGYEEDEEYDDDYAAEDEEYDDDYGYSEK